MVLSPCHCVWYVTSLEAVTALMVTEHVVINHIDVVLHHLSLHE